ncbi:hypothetical protein FBUS_03710, partial [Fasciolopsis buskii]
PDEEHRPWPASPVSRQTPHLIVVPLPKTTSEGPMPSSRQWIDLCHFLHCACGLMFLLLRGAILWISLTGLLSSCAQWVSTNDWTSVGLVATSIRPHFLISWKQYGEAGYTIELLRPETSYERCYIETDSPKGWDSKRKDFKRVFLRAPSSNTRRVDFTLTVICNTSQGQAKLPINMALDEKSREYTSIPRFQINPIPDSNAKSIQFYRVHWSQQLNERMIFLIYNSTHVHQHTTTDGYVNLENLAPNVPYVFCTNQAEQMLNVQTWRCIRYSTSLPFPEQFIEDIIIQAADIRRRENLVEQIRSESELKSCSIEKQEEFISLLGPWPDWEDYSDTGWDELGPLSDFTINLNGLADKVYDLKVWPVVSYGRPIPSNATIEITFSSSRTVVFLVPEDDDLNIRCSDAPLSRVTPLLWSLPDGTSQRLRAFYNLQGLFNVYVEMIGRPDEKRNQFCFVRGCNVNSTSPVQNLQQPKGSPQRLLCYTADVQLDLSRKDYSIEVPCLLPCRLYEIRVILNVNTSDEDSVPPISGRRRLIRVGAVYPMDSNQPVFSVAHNALLLQLDDEHASTHNMCLSNGYALSVESEDDQQIKLVRLLSRNQLDQWDDRFMADRISPLRNPLLNETKVKIAVQNFAVNPGADTRQSLPLQPSQCHLDCVWPSEQPSVEQSFPWSLDHMSIYGSAVSSSAQSTKCIKRTVSSGDRPSLCRVPPALDKTGHLYCSYDGHWGTCVLPRCDEMAPIRCVSHVKISPNTTSIILKWNQPQKIPLTKSALTSNEPAGFVVMIGTSRQPHIGSQCLQSKVLTIRDPGKVIRTTSTDETYIKALTRACDQFGRSYVSRHLFETQFENLTHNTQYEIAITSFSVTGQLGTSLVEMVQTPLAPPCTPVGLNIAQVLARAMRIRWSTRESQSCGTPTSVSVNYGRGSFDAKLHNQKLMEFLISPLDACQKYCIEIQLLNKAGASPVHPKVCGMTEREAFTSPPTLKSGKPLLLHDVAQCLVREGSLDDVPPSLDCDLRAHLVYTEKCPVHYHVRVTLFGSNVFRVFVFTTPELLIERNLEIGFVYLIKVKATAPNFTNAQDTGSRRSSTDQSIWSNQLTLFAGAHQFKLVNVDAHVELPTPWLPSEPLIRTCYPSLTSRSTQFVLPSNPELCIHVNWETTGPVQGLFGFALQVFVSPSERSDTVGNPTQTESPRSSEKSERCIGLFWIQCEDCLHPHSEVCFILVLFVPSFVCRLFSHLIRKLELSHLRG